MRRLAGWAVAVLLALLVLLGLWLKLSSGAVEAPQRPLGAAALPGVEPVAAAIAAVVQADRVSNKPAESLLHARRRWQAFARSSGNVAESIQFCRDEIASPERDWCLYQMARECTMVDGKVGSTAIAELEAAIASRGRSPVAQQLSQKREACRSYWSGKETLDPQQLVGALLAAEHPAIALAVALRQIPSELAFSQRARLVEKAWLAGDASTVTTVESAALDALGEHLPADQQFRHSVAGLASCRLSGDCDEDLSAEYERLCDRDLGASNCPLQQTRRELLQAEQSPSQFQLTEAYVDELIHHIERGDSDWKPLQDYLRALPPDDEAGFGTSP